MALTSGAESVNDQARSVLDFWFEPPGSCGHGTPLKKWFVKSDAFDEQIAAQFAGLTDAAIQGQLTDWSGEAAEPLQQLAYILLLDQFPRNIYRNTPRSFAGDERALAAARDLVAREKDQSMQPVERMFCYLPYEHSEVLADQHESLKLFAQLDQFESMAQMSEYAQKHFDFIERFGRFPHRNDILGRQSTPEEIEFLKQPGSRF